MLGGSLGLGSLHYRYPDFNNPNNLISTFDPAVGYSARLGFGLGPRLMLLIELNGATATVGNTAYSNAGYGSSSYDQTIYDIGLQWFVTRHLFLRGGAGIGNITESDGGYYSFGKVGFAMTGSVGVELLQGYNWSLELAAQGISGFYKGNERWQSGAVNIGFNFF
jgi:hypothetical protein